MRDLRSSCVYEQLDEMQYSIGLGLEEDMSLQVVVYQASRAPRCKLSTASTSSLHDENTADPIHLSAPDVPSLLFVHDIVTFSLVHNERTNAERTAEVYFLPVALAAALVTLPALSAFTTPLMTPTATVQMSAGGHARKDESVSRVTSTMTSSKMYRIWGILTSLSHVTDGETSQGWVVGEGLDTHGLGGNHLDDGGITSMRALDLD